MCALRLSVCAAKISSQGARVKKQLVWTEHWSRKSSTGFKSSDSSSHHFVELVLCTEAKPSWTENGLPPKLVPHHYIGGQKKSSKMYLLAEALRFDFTGRKQPTGAPVNQDGGGKKSAVASSYCTAPSCNSVNDSFIHKYL